MKKRKPARPKRKLFDPDVVLTELHQALKCDLQTYKHEYSKSDSLDAYAFERQVTDFDKKYVPPSFDTKGMESESFDLFRSINSRMLDTNLKLLLGLPESTQRIQSSTPFMDKVHLRARAITRWVLGEFDEDEWFQNCKNSSGASIGVPFKDTSMEKKFTFPMSSTVGAERYWRRYLRYDFQLCRELENFNSGVNQGIEPVSGSRATTVDKTKEKRRMICVEPTVNMYLQQGLMLMMYDRLSDVGLDLDSAQDRHMKLAWEASITGRMATIDFSSASDCVSIELLRWLLPPSWFDVCWILRSHHTLLDGEWTELQMMSTMGNATTFPLETIVFWAYAHAVRLSLQPGNSLFPEWEDLKLVRVFGDDCIVPHDLAVPFMEACREIGFIVNDDKSFYGDERFRESCGGDFLCGRNVRPFYIKAPVNTRLSSLPPWLYIITNSLLKKYIQYFGETSYIYEKELWRVIFSIFTRYNISVRYVPPEFPDDSGLKWSSDRERLENSYRFRSEPIYKDRNGTCYFTYHRFVYRKSEKQDSGLRLWLALRHFMQREAVERNSKAFDRFLEKNPELSVQEARRCFSLRKSNVARLEKAVSRKQSHINPKRVLGGYVVAKAFSGHWSF